MTVTTGAATPRRSARPSAVLLDDAGAECSSSAFFRSRPFLSIEGVTHSLVVETAEGRAAVPLVVRDIGDSGLRDAVSPYGYPGGSVTGTAPDVHELDLTGLGLVSVFLRDRLDRPCLRGGTARGEVLVHDPQRPRSVSRTFRREVRRNEREGYVTELLSSRSIDDDALAGFSRAYTETMHHVGASARYFWSASYLRSCLAVEGSGLVVVRSPTGEIVAGELVVTSDGHLHSYLAGTRTRERDRSPGKNATARVLDLADELGLPLNVGGGLAEGDGLAASKRSYANAATTFVTHEIVTDPERYTALTRGRPSTAFFPAYRAA